MTIGTRPRFPRGKTLIYPSEQLRQATRDRLALERVKALSTQLGEQVPTEERKRLATFWVKAQQPHPFNSEPFPGTQCQTCWGWRDDPRH